MLEYSTVLVAEAHRLDQPILAGLVIIWCVADEVQVVELAVHPQYRRRGIASALMTEALAIGTRCSA